MIKRFLLLAAMLFWCSVGFAECISGNCKNGQGTYAYKDGHKYVGEWKKKKRDGQGTYFYASGSKYVGEWRKNKKHGQGTWIFADGDKYVGGFWKNKFYGQGTYTYADGTKYVGGWKKGKKYNLGTFTDLDGTVTQLIDGKTFISAAEKAELREDKKKETKRLEEEKKQNKISSMIKRAESTCKELGFKEETEKFNDCKLKLYTQEVDAETAAKAAAKSTNRGQTIIVGPPRPYPKVACDAMGGLVC